MELKLNAIWEHSKDIHAYRLHHIINSLKNSEMKMLLHKILTDA
jgi:hypothetical protein